MCVLLCSDIPAGGGATRCQEREGPTSLRTNQNTGHFDIQPP